MDLKRQALPTEVFLEIKTWGAWNGTWIPYLYEPIRVPGPGAEHLNDVMARYRRATREPHLAVRKAPDNGLLLAFADGKTRFDLRVKGFMPRVTLENPEGHLALGVSDGDLNVNGHVATGRVAGVFLTPGSRTDADGRYGLYDHFTLQLPEGTILVVYHSRTRPGFNLAALLTADGKGDRRGRTVHVIWRKPWIDGETGRQIPSAWSVEAPEAGIRADLEEWGRDLVRYPTGTGKTAVAVNAMVRGWVEVAGVRMQVFGLNVHVQDD